MSKSQQIRSYLLKHPQGGSSNIARRLKCTSQLVSNVKAQMQRSGELPPPEKSKSGLIREHLKRFPLDSSRTIADKYECTVSLVSNVRNLSILKQQESVSHKVTPTEDGDNARKAPLNKRVKVSRSFLWGAIKYERYE